MLDFIQATDFYKTGHRAQMVPGTEYIYENFTARAPRIEGNDSVVFLGLQAVLKYDLTDLANRTFFSRNRSDVLYDYQKMADNCLGPGLDVRHIGALHDLGYLPLEFCALPEGTRVPYKIPMFTIENTHPEFAWVPGYLETLVSSRLWLPCTSATTAYRYRKLLDHWCEVTHGDPEFTQWQGHDFSFRGMGSPEAAVLSGIGHLLSFRGTDTIPAIKLLRDCYNGEGLIGGSVPATEHMVMCLGGRETERTTFRRLLGLYPKGVVSVVSDTWDLWYVITQTLPTLKKEIMKRDGKLVIRPDSGDPVLIITGDESQPYNSPARKGVVELLWDIFGGTINDKGFKQLDSHIGTIYGDSITEERARQICERLAAKRFASPNIVFGIGSYTYQHVTRDTHGFAIKATWAKVNGQERSLFKDPITDSGTKRSARGRLAVLYVNGHLSLVDGLDIKTQANLSQGNMLQPVWRDGRFIKKWTWDEVKRNLKL